MNFQNQERDLQRAAEEINNPKKLEFFTQTIRRQGDPETHAYNPWSDKLEEIIDICRDPIASMLITCPRCQRKSKEGFISIATESHIILGDTVCQFFSWKHISQVNLPQIIEQSQQRRKG